MSIELGNVICITDRSKAAERDARMLGKNGDPRLVLPPPKPEVLGSGLLQGDGAGRYLRQAAVKTVSGDGKFDGVVGMGWVLMGWVLIALDDVKLSLGAQKVWEKLGGKIARLLPKSSAPRSNALVDAAGRYHSAIRQLRKDAKFAIVRPDWYVYGLAKDQVELEGLLEKLGRQMFPDSARL